MTTQGDMCEFPGQISLMRFQGPVGHAGRHEQSMSPHQMSVEQTNRTQAQAETLNHVPCKWCESGAESKRSANQMHFSCTLHSASITALLSPGR
jgi:hypothetical protein